MQDKKKNKFTIKNCNCYFTKTGNLIRCKFHKQCIGDSCAPGINLCDNPDHDDRKKLVGNIKNVKLPKTWGQIKPINKKNLGFFSITPSFSNNHKANKPKCRFCGGETRTLNNNGIISNGYKEWDYVCKACGKVQ